MMIDRIEKVRIPPAIALLMERDADAFGIGLPGLRDEFELKCRIRRAAAKNPQNGGYGRGPELLVRGKQEAQELLFIAFKVRQHFLVTAEVARTPDSKRIARQGCESAREFIKRVRPVARFFCLDVETSQFRAEVGGCLQLARSSVSDGNSAVRIPPLVLPLIFLKGLGAPAETIWSKIVAAEIANDRNRGPLVLLSQIEITELYQWAARQLDPTDMSAAEWEAFRHLLKRCSAKLL